LFVIYGNEIYITIIIIIIYNMFM